MIEIYLSEDTPNRQWALEHALERVKELKEQGIVEDHKVSEVFMDDLSGWRTRNLTEIMSVRLWYGDWPVFRVNDRLWGMHGIRGEGIKIEEVVGLVRRDEDSELSIPQESDDQTGSTDHDNSGTE